MQRHFNALSEATERFLACWQGVSAYALVSALSYALWGWDGLDRWVYLSTAAIVLLLIGAGRRDSKAAHAKLDALTPGHDLDRLEEREEREIESARQPVPGVYREEQ